MATQEPKLLYRQMEKLMPTIFVNRDHEASFDGARVALRSYIRRSAKVSLKMPISAKYLADLSAR